MSSASSRADSSGQHDRLVARYGVRVACILAFAPGKIGVIPPIVFVQKRLLLVPAEGHVWQKVCGAAWILVSRHLVLCSFVYSSERLSFGLVR